MGVSWETNLEGGGGVDSLGFLKPHVSAGGNIVCRGDMGAHGANNSVVIGSACEFIEAGNT